MGARSTIKGPFIDRKLLKKVNMANSNNNHKSIKTWSRKSTILPNFIGRSFLVHNGKNFIPITITDNMVGKKLGEFAPTRKFKGHGNNRKQ